MDVLGRKLFGKTLFYPGCFLKYKAQNLLENYEQILRKIGVSYTKLHGVEQCCGLPAFNAGYMEDYKRITDANMQLFQDQNVSKIVTACAECYYMFTKNYPLLKVEHVSQVIAKNMNKIDAKALPEGGEEVTYYDPCNLGRKSGIYHEPRAILQKLGYTVKEIRENREKSVCCGAGGVLKENAPKIANKMALILLSKVKTKKLVTSCPHCYLHLKENSKDIEVYELSELIV